MNPYRAFSTTATGGSHSKHGKECQDFSLHYPPYGARDEEPVALAVVADGHGEDNCFRAAQGAEIAAGCAKQAFIDFDTAGGIKSADKPHIQSHVREIIKHIVARWQITVEEGYTKNPFTPEELVKADEKHRKRYEAGDRLYKAYGTTLIAAAITADYWFGVHIGDGRLTALYKDGGFDQPVPWDPKCFLNQTTSICDDDAADRARCYLSFHQEKEPPVAVFLCSDGVDDNYPVDGNEKHLFKLYRTIALTFAEDGFDSTCGQIKDLANSFATKGKGDDTSIAGFIDMEGVQQAAEVWRKQIAEEEARPAEAERAKAATAKAEVAKAVEAVKAEAAAENVDAETKAETDPKLLPVQPPGGDKPAQKTLEIENTPSKAEVHKAISAYNSQKGLSGIEMYGSFETEAKEE